MPKCHLKGHGCPICSFNISKPEIEFLNKLNVSENNRQKYINPYKVDGIKDNKIFEFLGDFYHGNPNNKRFSSNAINKKCHTTYGELYNNTIKKLETLNNMGYKVYYIWENDWNQWNKNKKLSFPLKKFNSKIII